VNNQWFSKVAVWLVIALVLFTVFKQFDRGVSQGSQIGYSDFLEEVRAKRIKAVTLQEGNGGTEILAVNGQKIGAGYRTSVLSHWATQAAGTRVALTLVDGSTRELVLADYF
jgi:ATP-dependent Zn protease